VSIRIGIDTGGTFSDFVLLDEASGRIDLVKVPSTPDDPSRAIESGIDGLGERASSSRIVVGTTVATNAIIQRSGPTVVLLTSEGFGDVVFIGRMDKEQLYDLHWQKPRPLVRRRDVVSVPGRVDHTGAEVAPLDDEALTGLRRELERYAGEDVVVAICLLFSYARAEHELAALTAVREALPGVPVSVSHQVSPLWREYERTSTTVADAFVKPVVDGYVGGVGRVLESRLAGGTWHMLASNGGYLGAERAREHPAQLLLSGLAGGIIGGSVFASAAGHPDVFTLDMGGTSCDLGLVAGGQQAYASEFSLAFGIPITIPCVAVEAIGAGGGSIAWVDDGGLLHVGPQSAGADPGPASYGTGGVQPTLTDANLLLGRLSPDAFLGGALRLDESAAQAAFATLGNELGLAPEAAALAAIRIADENMANAIRLIAAGRGVDPRDYALIAFGGAGPLHAREVAHRLDIDTLLIPPHPGVCSAFGAAIAAARIDRARTFYTRSDTVDIAALATADEALCQNAVAELRRSVDSQEPIVERSADMRYVGQNFELEVPIEGRLGAAGWDELLVRFAERHQERYGFALPGEPVELTRLRVVARHPDVTPPIRHEPRGDTERRRRSVWLSGAAPEEVVILARESLAAGERVDGPAVLEELDSTTLILRGDTLEVDPSGVLVITLGGAR
jgi:N-methylhydantoinase A